MTDRKSRKVVAPWSSDGWFGEEVRRKQSSEVYQVIAAAGRGGINPVGFRADKPGLASTPGTHNPYLNVILSGMISGVFLFGKLVDAPALAWAAGGFFWLAAIPITVMNIRRIPSWHRARRDVRADLREHPGKFPVELRWYS